MDRDLEYFNKLPRNRQKELRKMLRVFFSMREKGATYGEQLRLIRYAQIVARPAYKYYSSSHFELGIPLLIEKYYENPHMPLGDGYISYWIRKLLREGL